MHLQFICVLSFFTVSVFCLTSVAASEGNSLLSNSETGVSPSLDGVSGTLCLLHYVTETSHLYSLRDFEDTFACLGLRRIVTVGFLRRVQIFLLTYLLFY